MAARKNPLGAMLVLSPSCMIFLLDEPYFEPQGCGEMKDKSNLTEYK